MRKIVLVAAATATLAVACEAAYAQDQPTIELAQATTTAPADPAPADPAPAAPAAAPTTAQPAPAAQAAPDAAPTAKAKPAKKRVAKRRSWQSDEAKARSIAAKYGVTW
jgi:outer membrane biosynthesis protein TonB